MRLKFMLPAALAMLALAAGARAATAASGSTFTGSNPAGIGDYSYIQIQHSNLGSSRYFGETSIGNGFKAAYQFGTNAYVYGDFDRFDFGQGGRLYRTGIGLGYAQTQGRLSAYLRGGFYREIASGNTKPGRSYYWEFAYGLRGALNRWVALEGELYTELKPDFGSVPWGLKFGVAFALGPVSLHVNDDHNRQVNTLSAALRVAF